ncbi:hypothetical protein ACK3TF_003437 [Chlorella vulgaris]
MASRCVGLCFLAWKRMAAHWQMAVQYHAARGLQVVLQAWRQHHQQERCRMAVLEESPARKASRKGSSARDYAKQTLKVVSKRVANAKSERFYRAGLGKKKEPGFFQRFTFGGLYGDGDLSAAQG